MATLPSFVELMSSLGLDKPANTSPLSSPPSSPRPARSQSIPSLRDLRLSRYSPYGTAIPAKRRGSLPSSLPTSDMDSDMRPSPPSSSPRHSRKRIVNHLSVNVYDSTTDLAANTPISSYVRRKSPLSSPISPSFLRDDAFDSPAYSPMPFTLPTLPPLFCQLSSASDSFPPTPNSDHHSSSGDSSPSSYQPKPLPEFLEEPFIRRSYPHGVRISTPPRSADLTDHYRRRHLGAL
jgi:hypothetical protein